MSHTFVIIDGSSLMHRAFYALPLLTTASGQYTNAVYGFATMVIRLLGDIKPDAIAVALDKGKVTFRTEKYNQYKAHRKGTPSELSEQFNLVKDLLDALGIAVLEYEGYEADDIIGTLSAKAVKDGVETIIVTGDRDALQLISSRSKVMLTKKGISDMEMVDEKVFKEKYGLDPIQLIDLKGLMGDSSDNIPGVPGVGEKTALKLIAEYGSVENLIKNIDKISGKKLQENLRNNADLAVLSKDLATIICDMPIEFSVEEFKFRPNRTQLEDLFMRFEFKSLLARIDAIIPGDNQPIAQLSEALPKARIGTLDDINNIVDEIIKDKTLVVFPIIKGKAPTSVICGAAVINNETTFYIPADSSGWLKILDLIEDDSILKVTYNAKPLYSACLAIERELRGEVFDVLLASYLLDPTAAEYPLTNLKENYLGMRTSWTENKTIQDTDYAVWAVAAIKTLYPVLQEKLIEMKLDSLFNNIELPLLSVLASLEMTGIKVDNELLLQMAGDITKKVELLLVEICSIAGEQFNVNSTKQLGQILFEKLNLPIIKKTKTGYSTDAEVLEKLAGSHQIIDKLLEYRMLTKLKSTYLDGLQPLIDCNSGRIHTHFNQTVTATGRLSSSEPNLQNIPIRTDVGRRIRELFVPGESFQYIMSADYSQIELRVLAHMSGDDNLIEAFNENEDVHTQTAAKVFGVPINEVTSEMRARAKAVNFGIVYGISDYGLSRDIGVSRKEAGQYIESYFAKYCGVKKFIEEVVAEARRNGYVTTMLGRRRYLPDINSSNFNKRSFAERTAMNTPIQGTAADIIKKAMIDVFNALRQANMKSRILLQVHDELVLEVVEDEVQAVSRIVKEAMEKAISLDVPLIAEVKLGANWAQAK